MSHKEPRTPTYNSWRGMRDRCNQPTHNRYQNYGGRGIKVCEEWGSFTNFLRDMGERPDGLTLDRIDTDGDYSKENCRWATPKEQAGTRKHRKMPNSPWGIQGVTLAKQTWKGTEYFYWTAYASPKGKGQISLYHGKDFFEACCARKSWESLHLTEENAK